MDGVTKTSLKLRVVRELLAWDYASHSKCQLVSHTPKCTELCQSSVGKTYGFDLIDILWKAKEIHRVHHFCEGNRILEIAKFKPRDLLTQTSGQSDPLDAEEERQVIVLVNAAPLLKFILCDLKRKTELQVFSHGDVAKIISLEPI